MSSIEYMLVKLTAQSSGPNPKDPGGGVPQFTAADISLIASAAPHMAYHAMMAKFCDDAISEKALLEWARKTAIEEWCSNPAYAALRIEARQLNRMAELVVLTFVNPQIPHAKTTVSMAAYVGAAETTYRRNFSPLYSFLAGEIGYLEQIGTRAILKFRYGDEA